MYKTIGDLIRNTETGAYIPKDEGNRHFQAYLAWVAEGNEPEPEFTDEELVEQEKQAEIDSIIATYETSIRKPVECVAGGKTYLMDGLEASAVKMKHGIELAELTGAESMDIVNYYNKVHAGVPLSECYEIMLKQATSYLSAWQKKSKDRAAILYSE